MSRKRKEPENPRLEMAKAINNFCVKVESLDKAYEQIKNVTKDTLTEFDLEIEAKKQEIERLTEEDAHSRKRLKTETDLFIAEYRYDAAKKILAERDEVAIPEQVLNEMKDRLSKLTTERDAQVEAAVAAERQRGEAALKAATNNAKLTHRAETAVLEATNQQQTKEIESLQRTIESLKNEVAEQRNLTAKIADAGRAAPISQQFGK